MEGVRVEVTDRFTPGLGGRADRTYVSPPHDPAAARELAALLLDRAVAPEGDGPWRRALAGGLRTVRLLPSGR
ncbi:hypothetical protein [Conexibacter sp. SYSU D00693]|uniref:hypothetical protein n=1 Tax=Conexibacter sp. SYSU D00693 TaxID=2812560 RepID=UPI00196AAE10|nr:hypothetical protein [Conexibacter sp. SYSU D00693]